MIQYILECIAFQLVFLLVYDLFLKRETFFQWNRVYLMGTYSLSLLLPWMKIEALRTTLPPQYNLNPKFLLQLDEVTPIQNPTGSALLNFSWQEGVFVAGMLISVLLFGFKILQILKLKRKGTIYYFPEFTQVIVENSNIAFSFFKSIFLGDKVSKTDYKDIIQHELVHIKQGHSWDLLFFELMRIVGWFNPLVYLYQSRTSELHEFIADSQVCKTNKKEQYRLLLSQVFQSEYISFINPFFKSSLIKKRIVMLQKSKSKKIWKLKYLALLPMVLGILFYTSCEQDMKGLNSEEFNREDQQSIERIFHNLRDLDSEEIEKEWMKLSHKMIVDKEIISKEEFFKFRILSNMSFSKSRTDFSRGDTLHYFGSPKPFKNPTKHEYELYVNRTKAFQILDFDLWVSIDRELDVRRIEKGDKNLGPGDFISVENVRDLTGDELRKINRAIAQIDFDSKFLFISDSQNSFLITKIQKQNSASSGLSEDIKNPIFGDSNNVPFSVVEQAPIFPGCEDAEDKRACFNEKMQSHISEHFIYPREAQEEGIQGLVYSMFVISSDGSIQDIKSRGPHKILEDEVERIIKRLPEMIPGEANGQIVSVPYSTPITFRLEKSLENSSNLNTTGKEKGMMSVKGYTKNIDGTMYMYGNITNGQRGLPGANIIIGRANRSEVSNFDGDFIIEIVIGDVITFQYKGLPMTELTIANQAEYQVNTIL